MCEQVEKSHRKIDVAFFEEKLDGSQGDGKVLDGTTSIA